MSLSVGERMRRVRQRDTGPELRLRRVLHAAGIRFRACPSDLPGRPDVANKTRRWVIFVHGCFWHGHSRCQLATTPKTNRAWWVAKIRANRRRDQKKVEALRELGYKVVVVWQCELDDPVLIGRVLRAVGRRRHRVHRDRSR